MANFVEIDAELINLDQVTHIKTSLENGDYCLNFYHGDDVILSLNFHWHVSECNDEYRKWKEKLIKNEDN